MENEKIENELNEAQAETLADLSITDEQAEQAKGGYGHQNKLQDIRSR